MAGRSNSIRRYARACNRFRKFWSECRVVSEVLSLVSEGEGLGGVRGFLVWFKMIKWSL